MSDSLRKTINNMKTAIPMIIGVLLLVNLLNPLFQKFYPKIFTGNYFLDPFLGALGGSVSFGIPLTSYVAGGELLAGGVSLLAVTAFILAWTTVGLAMLPLEIIYLGKRFAIWRNVVNFFFSIIVAILTIITLNFLGL
ncbi:MAG TPA: hypothetical protein VKO42_04345 [Patescibacteria group bacterium]|nr:hypothetical protein [Patescibacteria group bacterium]